MRQFGDFFQYIIFQNVIEKAGKVAKISLVNFMCHAKLQLDFNDRMNFILGHNGAGKSVILTAIIIGLGGSAKATNRSSVISSKWLWSLLITQYTSPRDRIMYVIVMSLISRTGEKWRVFGYNRGPFKQQWT